MRAPHRSLFIAALTAAIFVAAPVLAQERDSDGTRMQARQVDVESSHSDSLSQPDDKADWRMIRLGDEKALTFELTIRGSDVSARITIAGATGDEVASQRSRDGSARVSESLSPGIYYIAVESSDDLRYELEIK